MRSHVIAVCCFALAACSFSGLGDDGDVDDEPIGPDRPGDSLDVGEGAAGPFQECAGGGGGVLDQQLDETILCLGPAGSPMALPLVVIEHAYEIYGGTPAVHVRLTFNPTFNDNTYGTGSIGWGTRPHKFSELVGSDHARLFLLDAADDVVFDVKLDYISVDPTAPCGYASLGPFGGDGAVNVGDGSLILGWQTSLDENLNTRGYCMTLDSPATTSVCSPPPSAPDWDFRVVYDLWVAASAFDPAGFGRGDMESVHASPSKGESTIEVMPVECPDDLPKGCLDPEGCAEPDPCADVDCTAGSTCVEGECVPIVQ